MKLLSIIVLPVLVAFLPDPNELTCTPKEIAFYDRMGWDSYECHGDKNYLSDSFDLEACGVTPDDDMEVSYGKLSRCTINEVKQK